MDKPTRQELIMSAVRIAFSAVPYISPIFLQGITEVFEFSGRVKQGRLNKFTEMFAEYFVNNPDIDIASLKNEDFGDLLESVLRRVIQTKSIDRYGRFKDVLIGQIQNPSEPIRAELHLDLISSLAEIDIKILFHHRPFDKQFYVNKRNLMQLKSDIKFLGGEERLDGKLASEITAELEELEELEIYRTHVFYNVNEDQFFYSKQILQSKALLYDSGIGGLGMRAFDQMGITEFGKEFIEFIIKS